MIVIALKAVRFQTEIILDQKLTKGLNLDDCETLILKDHYVEFLRDGKLFLVPLANINMMEAE